MQFQVPQFLEREAKIIGPLTLKQFFFIAGGILILVVFYYLLPKFFFYIFLVLVLGAAFSLAFVKVQGVPLTEFISGYFSFISTNKKYIWEKKTSSQPGIKFIEVKKSAKKEKSIPLKIAPESRLNQISKKVEFGIKE
jgi:hypothetical protein